MPQWRNPALVRLDLHRRGPRSEYSPREAIEAGVSVIYQHFSLVPSLTVADNIFLGTELQTGLRIDRAKQLREATALLAQFERPIRASQMVTSWTSATGSLSRSRKRFTENRRCLCWTTNGCDRRARSRAAGCALAQAPRRGSGDHVRYSSARGGFLDRRSGDSPARREDRALTGSEKHRAGTAHRGDLAGVVSSDSSVAAGCGARQGGGRARSSGCGRRRRRTRQSLGGLGEVVGIFGLLGSGRTELLEGIFGHRKLSGGFVMRDGSRYQPGSPAGALRAGVALVAGDRIRQSIFDKLSCSRQPVAAAFRSVQPLADLSQGQGIGSVQTHRRKCQAQAERSKSAGWSLSGGNQQKLALGRWLVAQDKLAVLLLDEPTQGIDVGARRDVYELVGRLARDEGKAVLFTSSDPEETLMLADRVLVLRRGRIVAEMLRGHYSERDLLSMAHGAKIGEEPAIASVPGEAPSGYFQ